MVVDVSELEREPFAGPQARGGGEHDDRPESPSELVGELPDLVPGFEGTLLGPSPLRVLDPFYRRICDRSTPT